MRRRASPLVLLVFAGLLAACGDDADDGSDEAQAVVESSDCVVTPNAEIQAGFESDVADTARQVFDATGATALLAAVRQGDEDPAIVVFGDSMSGVPATPDMHFRNGAVAIAYLSTTALLLAEDGDLDLEEPIEQWFPAIPGADAITTRMLAQSTSGIRDYVPDPDFLEQLEADPFRNWTPDELVDIAVAEPGWYEPGTNWSYSHANFVLLGQVLEAVSGQPLAELLAERIVEPLGLDETESVDTPAMPEPVLHGFATERGVLEDTTFWDPSWQIAPGAVMSTDLCDLLRSAEAIGTGELLSDESYEAMTTLDAEGIGGPTDECPDVCREQTEEAFYGLGVVRRGDWIVQNPAYTGFGVIMAYHPPTETAIAAVGTGSVTTEEGANPAFGLLGALIPMIG